MQRGLRVITLQEAIKKILKLPFLKDNKNYFLIDGSNNIFADCTLLSKTMFSLVMYNETKPYNTIMRTFFICMNLIVWL